jgi:hypothetical protein
MAIRFDDETLERFRHLRPEEALRRARSVVYGMEDAGSETFLELCEQLVEEGILTWDQVDSLERGPRR